MDDEIERHAPLRLCARERFSQLCRELGVVGFPELLAWVQACEINGVVAEGEFDVAAAAWRDFVDAAALFVAFLAVAGEHDAVAGCHGSPSRNDDASAANRFHFAHQHAALGGAQAGHEHLVIAAAEPARREAAREGELHFGDVLLGEVRRAIGGGRIEGAAVLPCDVGDILGRLEPAFDLEAAHAGVDEVGHECVRGQVLRAQQIFDVAQIDVFAVANQVVRAGGRPGHIGRGSRCGRRAIRW